MFHTHNKIKAILHQFINSSNKDKFLHSSLNISQTIIKPQFTIHQDKVEANDAFYLKFLNLIIQSRFKII
jgi:hypothetical protein